MMVDELLCVNGDEAQCRLAVREDNFFLEEDGLIAEVGIIEHIAQSASAFAGYRAVEEEGATEPPVGYIGEVKNFHLTQRPLLLLWDLQSMVSLSSAVSVRRKVENLLPTQE